MSQRAQAAEPIRGPTARLAPSRRAHADHARDRGLRRDRRGSAIAALWPMSFDRSDDRHVRLLLPDHHRRLEAKCRALVESDETGDAYALRLRWFELETELLEHLSAEEVAIIPSYAIDAPDDASRILTEHAEIRELLTPIRVGDESHLQHAERVARLVDLLDRHAEHEDAHMYPWAQRNLSQVTEHLLFKRVCAWFGLVHELMSPRHAV
jgi:hypothetical protein